MANPPKKKGTEGENQVVKILNGSRLFSAKRQPGSGMFKGHPDDVLETEVFDGTLEVKFRKSVPSSVYTWLGIERIGDRGLRIKENRPRALFMKQNYCPWLICMTAEDFIELCEKLTEKS